MLLPRSLDFILMSRLLKLGMLGLTCNLRDWNETQRPIQVCQREHVKGMNYLIQEIEVIRMLAFLGLSPR